MTTTHQGFQRTWAVEEEQEFNAYLAGFKANFGDEPDILPMTADDWKAAKDASEASGALHHAAGDHGQTQSKTITQEEWKYQKYHGYGEVKPDGTRYLLHMDDNGATVWGPVEIVG